MALFIFIYTLRLTVSVKNPPQKSGFFVFRIYIESLFVQQIRACWCSSHLNEVLGSSYRHDLKRMPVAGAGSEPEIITELFSSQYIKT